MALLALAVVVRFAAAPDAPREIPVSVSIVSSGERAAGTSAPTILAAPDERPISKPVIAPAPDMVRPSTMLSAKTLADPRSRQARADLATFADGERVAQLCNLEAMEQVHAWNASFRPEKLVAYARKNEIFERDTIEADGAAFFSRERWYDLRFTCEISADHRKVVAFAFKVGGPVPPAEWEDLGLPPGRAED